MQNAVIYARYSSDNQREESIDAQIRAIKYYAQNQGGYNIIRIYKDKAKTGKVAERTGFQAMLLDSAKGDFDVVFVHKLDRFSRNTDDAVLYEGQLRRNGVRLVSITEQLDSTPQGKFMKHVIIGMNQFYSDNLATEVMKGLKENAYSCRHTGGIPPLGYDVKKDKTYKINAVEAEAVKIIFNMYDQGCGYSQILDTLNAQGYRTKLGRQFGKNSLHEILKNEKYKGVFVYNKRAPVDAHGRRSNSRHKADSEIIRIDDGIPAIIDKEIFERVAVKMKANRKKGARSKAKANYLLSGILYCGHCGHSMTGDTSRYRGLTYQYYRCSGNKNKRICDKKRVHKKEIEAAVIKEIDKRIFSAKNIDEICKRIYGSYQKGDHEQIIAFKHEISKLERQIDNCVDAIADGLDAPELRDKLTTLKQRKQALQIKVYEIESVDGSGKTLDQIKKEFKSIGGLSKLSDDKVKAVIQRFVQRIYLYDHDNGDKMKIVISPYAKANDSFRDMTGAAPPPPPISQKIAYLDGCAILLAEIKASRD